MPADFGAPPEATGNPLLIWIIMAMGALLVGVLLWATWQTDEPARTEAQAPAVLPPMTPVTSTPTPVSAAPSPEPLGRLNPPLQTAPAPTTTPAAISTRQDRQATSRMDESTPNTAEPAEPVGKLPESMRGQVPKMNFGGAMHSDNPANRMLIINGQLFHEGDTVSPDLVLQEIQLKSATFRYRGYRHTVQF